ncbi:MAG: biotin transporter BioY [Ruminococcus sp.]|nr:biotin transporter BioY [Ruminococcus sp.]
MKKTRNMTRIALFTAVIAVCSSISIPLPSGMPLTLQTFAAALAGFVLGWKHAAASVSVYLMLGAVGIPVFSGFTGGFARLFGLTGGYLWGFLLLAAFCGAAPLTSKGRCAFLSLLGLLLCHSIGALQFALAAQTTPLTAFLTASAPYLIKDVLSLLGAYGMASALKRAWKIR